MDAPSPVRLDDAKGSVLDTSRGLTGSDG